MKLSFGNMTAEINIFHVGKQPTDHRDQPMDINFVQEVSENLTPHAISSEDSLSYFLAHFGMDFDVDDSIRELNTLLDSVPYLPSGPWRQKPEPLNPSGPPPLPSSEIPPQLELKPLPENLKYAFLGPSETLPVLIASDLNFSQEAALLEVLREHRQALGWTMAGFGVDHGRP